MLAFAVVLVVAFVTTSLRLLWRIVAEAAEDHRRGWHVEAVIALDDELLVLLEGGSPLVSRWLHSRPSVQAVVMLARWRHAHTPIAIADDEHETVLRPGPSQIGLRFRQQETLSEVDVVRMSP